MVASSQETEDQLADDHVSVSDSESQASVSAFWLKRFISAQFLDSFLPWAQNWPRAPRMVLERDLTFQEINKISDHGEHTGEGNPEGDLYPAQAQVDGGCGDQAAHATTDHTEDDSPR